MHRRPSKTRWLERKILLGVLAVVAHPKTTLICAAVVFLISGLSAFRWLNISSDDNNLFSPRLKAYRDYAEFDNKFPENNALYVVIETRDPKSSPPVARWTAAADAIVASVRQKAAADVESIDARVPLDKLGAQGLLFQAPKDLHETFDNAVQFSQLARLWGERIDNAAPDWTSRFNSFVAGRTPSARFLTGASVAPDPNTVALVGHIAAGWKETLSHPDKPIRIGDTVPDLVAINAQDPGDLGYYWQPDASDPNARMHPDQARHLLIVRIYPHVDYTSLSAIAEPIAEIRKAVQGAAEGFPEFTIGTTGRPALDADEMSATDRDSKIAEIIAGIAVFIGLLLVLRSLWLALAAEISLAVGIGWTFGWATLTVGKLNLLSIVFLIALIGIGMDYLVQILTRYRTEARRHARAKGIWIVVFRHVSAPISTACFGAAGAFLVLIITNFFPALRRLFGSGKFSEFPVSTLTNFTGAAELGLIAGGGLLLCLLSGYTVLPALLTIVPAKLRVDIARRPTGLSPKPQGFRRLILPVLWICLIALGAPWALHTHFDANLLALQAPNLESTKLIGKLQTWFSVVLSKDPAVLRRVRTAVERTKVVAGTESILTAEDNDAWLQARKDKLPKVAWATPLPMQAADVRDLASRATATADRLSELAPTTSASDSKQRQAAISSLRAFARSTGAIPPHQTLSWLAAWQQEVIAPLVTPAVANRLSPWQTAFVVELREMLAQLSPEPLNVSKLPPELRNHLVSADGTYALYITPKPEMDLWDRRQLAAFVNQVNEAATPLHVEVTGLAPDIYYTTGEVRQSFRNATMLALLVIVLLVLIDLRNIAHTLLAISVLAMGLPLLVEVMGILNVNWNFANFFGLPILIGAGHEYGVFMIHRYREALRDPRRAWHSRDVADRALLLCAYITSASFGFFWLISAHRGLKSLGLVMALGTACIYLSTVMVLRPLLLWRLERKTS